MTPDTLIQSAHRIVIKIGSAILTDEKSGEVRQDWLKTLSDDVNALIQQDKEIIIVSSGAIALGRKALGISYTDRSSSIPLEQKQAAAALGQVTLSQAYSDSFAKLGLNTALILLSPKDTEERQSHLNARATLLTLIKNKIIPIINENDTVSTAEIRFGDNDRLAARIAQMINADLLIQLSTTDGLYDDDPTQNPKAAHIPLVENINTNITAMAGDAPAGLSTGGMKSKLEAATIATQAGVDMMITSGKENHPLSTINKATIFKSSDKPINARKKWIASHVKTEGTVVIDDGAVKALKNGKSLLAVGVKNIDGDFTIGAPLSIADQNGAILGVGLSAYKSKEAKQILGQKSDNIAGILGYSRGKTLIHQDDLALKELTLQD